MVVLGTFHLSLAKPAVSALVYLVPKWMWTCICNNILLKRNQIQIHCRRSTVGTKLLPFDCSLFGSFHRISRCDFSHKLTNWALKFQRFIWQIGWWVTIRNEAESVHIRHWNGEEQKCNPIIWYSHLIGPGTHGRYRQFASRSGLCIPIELKWQNPCISASPSSSLLNGRTRILDWRMLECLSGAFPSSDSVLFFLRFRQRTRARAKKSIIRMTSMTATHRLRLLLCRSERTNGWFYLANRWTGSQLLMSFAFNDGMHYNVSCEEWWSGFSHPCFSCKFNALENTNAKRRRGRRRWHYNLNRQCIGTNCGECVAYRRSMASQCCLSAHCILEKNAAPHGMSSRVCSVHRRSECTAYVRPHIARLFSVSLPCIDDRMWCWPAAIAVCLTSTATSPSSEYK